MPDYSFRWNNYSHPALKAAFDFSTRTPGGLMKNLTGDATYDGTINGTWRQANPLIRAKKTPCWDMDGVNDYISLANPINGLSVFTILCWMNQDVGDGIIFARGSAAGTYWYDAAPGNKLQWSGIYNSLQRSIVNNNSFMIIVNRDSSGRFNMYQEAKSLFSWSAAAPPADANAKIGAYWDATQKFNGRLDNMLFYNVALTPAQIWAIYRSSIPRM